MIVCSVTGTTVSVQGDKQNKVLKICFQTFNNLLLMCSLGNLWPTNDDMISPQLPERVKWQETRVTTRNSSLQSGRCAFYQPLYELSNLCVTLETSAEHLFVSNYSSEVQSSTMFSNKLEIKYISVWHHRWNYNGREAGWQS